MPFAASYSLEHADLASAVFASRVVERGIPVVHTDAWATRVKTIDLEGERLFTASSSWNRTEVITDEDTVVSVSLQMGHATVSAAAPTDAQALALLERARAVLPAPDPSGRKEVTVTFWTYGPHGPQPAWRTIGVPEWSDIDANYTAPVRASLEGLMTSFQPAHGGQLVLWHGESGTGKTFALRALAWEWRDWCDVHYVVDPDSFFGEHADYLMHVLMQSEHGGAAYGYGWTPATQAAVAVQVGGDEEQAAARRDWRLLVLEDTGELLQPDAKAIIGQGLARFLNLVDGLIGQGLRVLVLVTTNEEIRKLHPAVARPGRCAADIEFTRLSADESNAWLEAHGSPSAADGAQTIAELYGALEGDAAPKPSEPFGDGDV